MPVLFIDESKQPNYLVVATLVIDADVPKLRKILKALVIAGQRSIHFRKEKASRRRDLISMLGKIGFTSYVFRSELAHELEARTDCLEQIFIFARKTGVSRLVFERDDSIIKFDEKVLYALSKSSPGFVVGFEHLYRHEEPLLWVPDALAWCENQRGDWVRRMKTAGLKAQDV